MITGSHNDAEYNGFKQCRPQHYFGDEIQNLRAS